jgi:hypothetical protein
MSKFPFPPLTDAESIRLMLMLPWTMGDKNEVGSVSYDASEIEAILRHVKKLGAAEKAGAEMLKVLKGVQLAYWHGEALEVHAHGWPDDVQAIIMEVDPTWYDQYNAPFHKSEG